ncbi:MAG: site-specific integrase [Synergistaceae bacterium]|nr:site-specific integrase [Synergistaceae bacterium]
MQLKLTQNYVVNLKPTGSRYKIHDTVISGLVLLVLESGRKTWYCDYDRHSDYSTGRKRTNHKIGPADLITVAEAREMAREFLSRVARGEDPDAEKLAPRPLTLREFITEFYAPWAIENRPSGENTIRIIMSSFPSFLDLTPAAISILQIERWRNTDKAAKKSKSASLNRKTSALKAALNWGVKRGLIEKHSLARLEPLSETDSEQMVRFLSDEEFERLMAALDVREEKMRSERDTYNAWRDARGLTPFPDLRKAPYVDYLKPMVIISLNTGIRKNSLFSLEWRDVDLDGGILTLRAAASKSGKINYVPLNRPALEAFTLWRKQSEDQGEKSLVFLSPKTGGKFDNCQSSWEGLLKEAGIENFRWHDMRHHFASKLVMKGADLNTVRELLGHSDLKMTLRYAHLAPEIKKNAVAMLE